MTKGLVIGLGILIGVLWVLLIMWITRRVFMMHSARIESFLQQQQQQQQEDPWVSEDPCNQARVPLLVVRESVMRILNEFVKSTPYFLPPNTPSAVHVERAWSLRRSGFLLWRVDVAAYVLNHQEVDFGGVCIRLSLQHPLTATSESDPMLLTAAPRIVETNVPSQRVLMLASSPLCGP